MKVVIIDHLQEEQITPRPGQPPEWKLVLYFRNRSGAIHPQGYLISAKVDKDALQTATGAQAVGELAGKHITIKLDEYKRAKMLRIDPHPASIQYSPRPYHRTLAAAREEADHCARAYEITMYVLYDEDQYPRPYAVADLADRETFYAVWSDNEILYATP